MPTEKATYTLEIDWDGDGTFEVGEDCSEDRLSAVIERGFVGPLGRRAKIGTATLTLDNQTRAYSPPLNASVRPQRQVRLSMTYAGTTDELYRGYIETIVPTSGTKRERRVTFTCVDDMERLERYEGPVPLLEHATADAIVDAAVNAVYTPTATSYQAGINVFPFSSDRWDGGGAWLARNAIARFSEATANAADKITAACMSDWGRFFIAKDGTPTFYNRHQMPLGGSTALTLDDAMVEMAYEMSVTSVYNHIAVTCYPRSVGTVYEVLGRLGQGTAPAIEPGQREMFTLYFRDPSNASLRLGGKNVINPVANTDYTATTDEPGEGDDATAALDVSSDVYGDRAEVALENTGAVVVYVQKLEVRGIGVRVREPVTVIAQDTASIATYGRRELVIDAPLMSTQVQAQALAEYLLDYYKAPLHDVRGVTFFANKTPTFMAAARDLELCDRVALTESQTGLSAQPLFIYAIRHVIEPGRIHRVTLDLEQGPDYAGDAWTWDASVWDGGDVWIY